MLDRLLDFLAEDLGTGDITSDCLIPRGVVGKARLISREHGVLAGAQESALLLDHFGIEYEFIKKDGEPLQKADVILKTNGTLHDILVLERLMLNVMGRMSGIATLTYRLASLCEPYGVKVMGTRKTTPGFRYFEKKAIEIGGGMPHRMGLYDAILIKDNHLAYRAIEEAVKLAIRSQPDKDVEIEVTSLDQAIKAAGAGAHILLLDNQTPQNAAEIICGLKEEGLREQVILELSGRINQENILDYARTGCDRISMGSLTTAAPWLDLSMQMI